MPGKERFMFDPEKSLQVTDWMVLMELAASCNQFGEIPNDVEVIASGIPVSKTRVAQVLGSLALRGVITLTSNRVIITDEWKTACWSGTVQIRGVLNWHVLCYARTGGFFLKDSSSDSLVRFLKRDRPSSQNPDLLTNSDSASSNEPEVFERLQLLGVETDFKLREALDAERALLQ